MEEYLQVKGKFLSSKITPHFAEHQVLEFPGLFEGINQNEYLYIACKLLLEIHFAINIHSVVRVLSSHRRKCFLEMFKNCEAFLHFAV